MALSSRLIQPDNAVANSVHGRPIRLQRKCACGKTSRDGECTECKSKKRLQAKLSIGPSTDPLEQEADRIADQVLAAPAHSTVSGARPLTQRFTEQSPGQADTVPAIVDRVLAGHGRPLDIETRSFMEARFGHDFGRVRVHTSREAADSAYELNALAYTVGQHVVFGQGQFAPETSKGKALIAHELAHTVQQPTVMPPVEIDLETTDPLGIEEREATYAADAAVGARLVPTMHSSSIAIARQLPESPSADATPAEPDPFAGETPELRFRRLAVIVDILAITQVLSLAVSRGVLQRFEKRTSKGVNLEPESLELSWEERRVRLAELFLDLMNLKDKLERAPIPADWLDPRSVVLGLPQPESDDVLAFYWHFAQDINRNTDVALTNRHYLTAEASEETPTTTGIYIQVPDPANQPGVYHDARYATWDGGPTFEVFEDSFGFFYYPSESGLEEKWYLDAKTEADIIGSSPSWKWEAK